MNKVRAEEMIETHLDGAIDKDLKFGYWDDETDTFIPLTEELATEKGIPVILVGMIEMFTADILEKFMAVNRDLKELGAKIL